MVNLAKYRCLNCRLSRLAVHATLWRCESCGREYSCTHGIPKLFLEDGLAERDRELRDSLYDGFVGSYYRFVIPFLTLPARPLNLSWPHWTVYSVLSALLLGIAVYLTDLLLVRQFTSFGIVDVCILAATFCIVVFFTRYPYFLFLFILAVPVKVLLLLSRFQPDESFPDVHRQVIEKLKTKAGTLQVLDISTGSCASLYKHGWMELNAEYTGIDLSETMLMQGREFMARKGIPVELALADATNLPLQSETFDVVLNYGAINGISDPARALGEMVRVTKKGGMILFLDEQLYPCASAIERVYFKKVLSSHNVIHECPVGLLPVKVTDIKVYQVYQFYYICTASKIS